MPSRRSHRQDPVFRNIERWDDGYDARTAAVPPVPPVPDTRMPYYPPPPQQTGPSTKTAKYIPKYAMEDRETRPRSPPLDSYEPSRPRRTRHRSPSPLRRSYPLNRDEGTRHRDREGRLDPPAPRRPVTRRPSFHAVKTTPAPFAGGRITPSPSPPPTHRRSHRDRDVGKDRDRPRSHSPPPRRHHSPAPPRRTKTTNNSPLSPAKHSSRNKATVAAAAPHRPGLARSKTTAAALGRNATEILSNPRFQKAAAAALQAGGMAALRQWKAPGAWAGQKGASVATAALGAAAMDAFAKAEAGGSTKPARSSPDVGGGKKSGGAVKSVGSALGGLLVEQLAKSGSGKRDKR